MKRVLILLINRHEPLVILALVIILAGALHGATGVAPSSAFPPFPPQINLNTQYWNGWIVGETSPILVPDSTYPDWWTYYAAVKATEPPRYRLAPLPFFPINYNDGFDDAEELAAHWLYYNTPSSCGVMVCNSANARKRVKPPMIHRHLDLTGKATKDVIKVVYRGARVIL